MIKRYLILISLLALVLLGLWLLAFRSGKPLSNHPITGAPLPKDDTEQIVVDPRNHTIIICRPSGDIVTHLPDKPTVIDIHKDGTVKVTAPQWGLEARPFIGFGYSDDVRFALGLDGLYWKRLDLGGGIQVTVRGRDPRAFIGLSYNVKDNLRIHLTVDHTKQVGVLLSLRI